MNTEPRDLTIDDFSYDRWTTRDELHHRTGLGDRSIRDQVNEMRKHTSTLIISSCKYKGYKRPKSIEEIELCLNESRSRVKDEEEKQAVLMAAIHEMRERARGEQLFFDF